MAAVAANAFGLTFSISPSKKVKSKKQEDDEEYFLTLAPFTKPPKVSFGTVKLNETVERTVIIINPQQFQVDLNVSNEQLNINNYPLTVAANQSINLKIKWSPEKPDNYKYSILFEVTNSARLKFIVHAYGICVKPEVKKTANRKPFTMLQPLKEKSSNKVALKPIEGPPATSALSVTKTSSVTASLTTVTTKSQQFCDKTIIIKKENKENNNKNLYNPSHLYASDDLDLTPKPNESHLLGSLKNNTILKTPHHHLKSESLAQSHTPKLCDYLKPTYEMNEDEEDLNITTMTTTTMTTMTTHHHHMTKIAGTKLMDISADPSMIHPNPNQYDDYLRTPNLNSILYANKSKQQREKECNDSIYESSSFGAHRQTSLTSTVKITSNSHKNNNNLFSSTKMAPKTPKMTSIYSLNSSSSEEESAPAAVPSLSNANSTFQISELENERKNSENNLLKSVLLVQRQWRYKRFRRALKQAKIDYDNTRLNVIVNGKMSIAEEVKEIEIRKQEEFLKQKERTLHLQMQLAEYERAKREKAEHEIKYIILCQKWVRMKRFRKYFHAFREQVRLEKKERERQYQAKLQQYTVLCQKAFRYKKFKKSLARLQQERQYECDLLEKAIVCQKWFRYKRFKQNLSHLKVQRQLEIEYQAKLLQSSVLCQKLYRYKKFKQNLIRLRQEKQAYELMINKSATVIQKQWHMYRFRSSMQRYRESACKIQYWYRHFLRDRIYFIRLRKFTVQIQQKYKQRFRVRTQAAICIQSVYRMHVERKQFILQKQSVLKIETWFKSKVDRVRYLKLKRSLPTIQSKCKDLVRRQTESARKIQRAYRMHKFRQCMRKYREAAVKIQRWTRDMKQRFTFLQVKRSVLAIQHAYRNVYMKRRIEAAIRIQSYYRMHSSMKRYIVLKQENAERLAKMKETERLNKHATKIQALWRGYKQRKETGENLNGIRQRLSMFQAGTSSTSYNSITLGSRIRTSLEIIKYPNDAIQRIMQALNDLYQVTRLSPECCSYFAREGAVEILFNFIHNCNRSVPHMDLVKMCLQIFINLAKYSETCEFILKSNSWSNIFMSLCTAYHTSNPLIFMNVCIILIILCKYEVCRKFLLEQDGFLKKLEIIYGNLDRKAKLSLKVPNASEILANKVTEHTVKKTQISFTLSPEWSLARKDSITVVNSLGALEALLHTLNITPAVQSSAQQINSNLGNAAKTPRKMSMYVSESSHSCQKKPKMSSSQSIGSLSAKCVSQAKIPTFKLQAKNNLPSMYDQETVSFAAKKNLNMCNKKQLSQDSTISEETIYYESTEDLHQEPVFAHQDESYFTAFSSTARFNRMRPNGQQFVLNSTLNQTVSQLNVVVTQTVNDEQSEENSQ